MFLENTFEILPWVQDMKTGFMVRYLQSARFAVVAAVLFSMVVSCEQAEQTTSTPTATVGEQHWPPHAHKFGFDFNRYFVEEGTIKENEFLADILLRYNVSYETIHSVAQAAEDVFSVKELRSDKDYYIFSQDTSQAADYFVYEPNRLRYVVYDLAKKEVEVIERPLDRQRKAAYGVIENSLWLTMMEQGLNYELAARMEDALAWSVSFSHIQQGDFFKVVYDELFVDGESVGIGELHGAYFNNSNNDHYAIKYDSDKYKGYYDLKGRPMEKVFLKAPVKYSRISSRYNPRRFHPVLRRVKAHLGTDYAAPRGTPIYAVANGLVTARSFTKGNGNYVKIKHDKTYSTQYLHMSKFAKGVTKGTQVVQGQVIGYVGSTGLVTGPHVCFRFWKNGKQVNFMTQNLPEPDPMAESELPQYYVIRDQIKGILESIEMDLTVAKKEIALAPAERDAVGD